MTRLNACGLVAFLAVGLVGCGDDDGGYDAGPDGSPGAVCGDGTVDVGEACDDTNVIDGDGCSSTCTVEECGNGVLDFGEHCDDNNLLDGDGCSSTCLLELAQTAEFIVPCCVGGDPASCSVDATLDLPVILTVDPVSPGFSTGAATSYTASIDSTLAQALTQLVLNTLMTDQLTIDSFDFSLTVTGGTPSAPSFTSTVTPVVVDIDANNDGTAEAVVLGSGAVDGSLTHDGVSSDVVFEFGSMSVTVLLPDGMGGSLPLVIDVPTPSPGLVNCALPTLADTQLTFPVN